MRGYRIGIVHPGSPFGRRLRELLAEGDLPVIELKLFESELSSGAALTQFGDDVVVTQPIDPDLLPHLDVLFVAGNDSDLMNRMAHGAAQEGVLTLVEGAVGLGGSVVTPDRLRELASGGERLGIVPRVASYLLGASLGKIAESHSIERAVATVLVPAQAFGDPGAAELHQQVVQILNFKTPPTEVLHEQLAFNVKLLGDGNEAAAFLAESVAWEASRLAGIEAALAVCLVQVPVFHGYSAGIWVETREEAHPKTLRASFRENRFEVGKSARGGRAPTPVSIAGSEKVHIGPIRRGASDGPRGFWVWAVADTTAYDPAAAALDIVRTVLS